MESNYDSCTHCCLCALGVTQVKAGKRNKEEGDSSRLTAGMGDNSRGDRWPQMADQMGSNRDTLGEEHRWGLGWWWTGNRGEGCVPGLSCGEVSLACWPWLLPPLSNHLGALCVDSWAAPCPTKESSGRGPREARGLCQLHTRVQGALKEGGK